MPSELLRIEALRGAHFGPVSLSLGRGETVIVSGPSGSGKTLFLRAVADLDPNEGRVLLNGVKREAIPPAVWRRRVGLLPAEPAWWAPTVGEHFPPHAEPPLEALGLPGDALSWTVPRLSTGERQRLALLRLLANGPDVLLLDEPTANLDARSRERVEGLLLRYCEDSRCGTLWVTHDTGQGRRLGARLCLFEAGRITRCMRPDALSES